MHYIDINRSNIIEAREWHFKVVRYIIKKRIDSPSFSGSLPIGGVGAKKVKSDIPPDVLNYLEDDVALRRLICSEPDVLNKIKNEFKSNKSIIDKIFRYDLWSVTKCASSLAQILDIPTCPYCNRMYTKTVRGRASNSIIRPTFDHWFPKSKFPILQLSFYNLIPSCNVCNSSLKMYKTFFVHKHFHPYMDKEQEEYFNLRFTYKLEGYNKPTFKIEGSRTGERHRRVFKLEEIYKAHDDELEDLLKIRYAYSDEYIKTLHTLVGGKLTKEEVYRLAFGVHFDEDNHDRRPLSKMKKDILTELGITL